MPPANPNNYFDRFPGFEPDPRQSLEEEFNRLARFKRWDRNSHKFARERKQFFQLHFDMDLGMVDRSKKLEDWQALCRELRINPIPESIRQCKSVWNSGFMHPQLLIPPNHDVLGIVNQSPCQSH